MRTSPTLGRTSGVGKEVPTKQTVNELRKAKKVTEVTVVKNPPASAADIGDTGLIPGFKTPWSWAWHATSISLPGEPHGQRSLEGYSPKSQTRLK